MNKTDLPWTPAVAELISKRWEATTIAEYAQAVGAVQEADTRWYTPPMLLPYYEPGHAAVEYDDEGVIVFSASAEDPTQGQARIVINHKVGSVIWFRPIDILLIWRRQPLDFGISFIAERNFFLKLEAVLPKHESAAVQARYRGELLSTLFHGLGCGRNVTPWFAAASKHWQHPVLRAYFETGWWSAGTTTPWRNGFEPFKGDAKTLGMFNGEWLDRRGKPFRVPPLPEGRVFALQCRELKYTRTMQALDVDYGRFTAVPPSYTDSLKDNDYSWSQHVAAQYGTNILVRHPDVQAELLMHFIQKGWL